MSMRQRECVGKGGKRVRVLVLNQVEFGSPAASFRYKSLPILDNAIGIRDQAGRCMNNCSMFV